MPLAATATATAPAPVPALILVGALAMIPLTFSIANGLTLLFVLRFAWLAMA